VARGGGATVGVGRGRAKWRATCSRRLAARPRKRGCCALTRTVYLRLVRAMRSLARRSLRHAATSEGTAARCCRGGGLLPPLRLPPLGGSLSSPASTAGLRAASKLAEGQRAVTRASPLGLGALLRAPSATRRKSAARAAGRGHCAAPCTPIASLRRLRRLAPARAERAPEDRTWNNEEAKGRKKCRKKVRKASVGCSIMPLRRIAASTGQSAAR
jgi:hypothetical protein